MDGEMKHETPFTSSTRDVVMLKENLRKFCMDCRQRNLLRTQKWLSEIIRTIQESENPKNHNNTKKTDTAEAELSGTIIIPKEQARKFYFICPMMATHQYYRTAVNVNSGKDARTRFFKFYANYKHLKSNDPCNMENQSHRVKMEYYDDVRALEKLLRRCVSKYADDAFLRYMHGLYLMLLKRTDEAIREFIKAINLCPLLWEAWEEIYELIDSSTNLKVLELPVHWIRDFFLLKVYSKLHRTVDTFNLVNRLQGGIFGKCSYITSYTAKAYNNIRDVSNAICLLKGKHVRDPYNMMDLDIYSNVLYVNNMKRELAALAQLAYWVNKYTPESCCILGNYFSIRGDHRKAADFFQRAITLNARNIEAMILRGHEYMEMKNTFLATINYREAASNLLRAAVWEIFYYIPQNIFLVDENDFRAHYGLGQTYEILGMPLVALRHYKSAQRLAPDDSRMLIATAETYEKLAMFQNALKCYQRARIIGDIDSFALSRMAKLYKELNMHDKAVESYKELVDEIQNTPNVKEYCEAYRFLAYYYLATNKLEEAFQNARKCLDFEEVKEEGRAMLKEIANLRENGCIPPEEIEAFEKFFALNHKFASLHFENPPY